MSSKSFVNDETGECSPVTLAVALLVRLVTFFLTEVNSNVQRIDKYYHFKLSNAMCKTEELIILAVF